MSHTFFISFDHTNVFSISRVQSTDGSTIWQESLQVFQSALFFQSGDSGSQASHSSTTPSPQYGLIAQQLAEVVHADPSHFHVHLWVLLS